MVLIEIPHFQYVNFGITFPCLGVQIKLIGFFKTLEKFDKLTIKSKATLNLFILI